MSSTPAFQLLTPKIPIMFFHQIVTFFRDVHTKQGTEAAALIRWNQERQEYYVEIPGGPDGKEQDLSAGSVKYKPDPTNKDIIVMDIHSHHTMTDFFSSIDDADEQFTQLYGVVGNIDHSSPTASFRARMHGEDIATPVIEDIFDISPYPETWMEKIKEPPKSFATEVAGPPWSSVTEDDRPWMGDVRDADVPPSTQDKWYERRMGESLSDYARRMQDIKNGSRGSLPRDFPTQKDGEEDEAYLKRITGQTKEPAPTMGDVLNGDEILTAQSEVWDVIENELLERAEIYQHRTPLMALRDYINDKFNEVNTSELAQWAKA
jgi:PRTRC genetic system protein A